VTRQNKGFDVDISIHLRRNTSIDEEYFKVEI